MSFFDSFFNNSSNNTAEEVILSAGTEKVTVPATEAKGKTIGQLFAQYASVLGIDADRINRFVDAGRIVSENTPVEIGHSYSGAVSGESKGLI